MALDPATLWPLALLLLATGLLAGVVAGLLGVGGGIVVVPVLYNLFTQLGIDPAVRMHLAVGTSLGTVIFTAARSASSHRARGALDAKLLRAWLVPVLLGVLLGNGVAGFAGGPVLTGVFACVALVVALHMAFGSEDLRFATQPPVGAARLAVGGGIGFLSVLMGLGGGTLGVPILTLLGVPIHRAVGTAAGLGLVIAIPGTVGFLMAGFPPGLTPPATVGSVNLMGVMLIAPASVLTAPLGVRLAHAASRVVLRRAFAAFLAITSLRMFLGLI